MVAPRGPSAHVTDDIRVKSYIHSILDAQEMDGTDCTSPGDKGINQLAWNPSKLHNG